MLDERAFRLPPFEGILVLLVGVWALGLTFGAALIMRPIRRPQPGQPHQRQPAAHLILGLLVRTTLERKPILSPSACRR